MARLCFVRGCIYCEGNGLEMRGRIVWRTLQEGVVSSLAHDIRVLCSTRMAESHSTGWRRSTNEVVPSFPLIKARRNCSCLFGVKVKGVALSVPIAPLLAAVSFIAPELVDLDNLEVLRLSLGLEGERSGCVLDKVWANVVDLVEEQMIL